MDIEGFQEGHSLLVNKAEILKENDILTKKLVHSIKFEDSRLVMEENDVLRNQLN